MKPKFYIRFRKFVFEKPANPLHKRDCGHRAKYKGA